MIDLKRLNKIYKTAISDDANFAAWQSAAEKIFNAWPDVASRLALLEEFAQMAEELVVVLTCDIETAQAYGTPGKKIGTRCVVCRGEGAGSQAIDHDSECRLVPIVAWLDAETKKAGE